MSNHLDPFGPVIGELEVLVPLFPLTKDPKDEAVFFAYSQMRIAYFCLCNLLQNGPPVIGLYIYAWSIIDNCARLNNLLGLENGTLRGIRNAFQHVEEKLEQYKEGIPVFGGLSWFFLREEGGAPTHGVFPERLNRSFMVGIMKGCDPITLGISHLSISALPSTGRKDTDARQVVVRLDHLVLDKGRLVCDMFGKEEPSTPFKVENEALVEE